MRVDESSRARGCRRLLLAEPTVLVLLAAAVGAQEIRPPDSPVARLDFFAPLPVDEPVGYFIAAPEDSSHAISSDAELCRWALEDWARQTGDIIQLDQVPEPAARIRIYFVPAQYGQYGEMRPILVDGDRGAEVYVRPDTDALGPEIAAAAGKDPLLRETIVYLTCLHEIGHALGMQHTAVYEDIMYYFGYGGDIPAFFGRYRSKLESRDDIVDQTGLSAGDIGQFRTVYGLR